MGFLDDSLLKVDALRESGLLFRGTPCLSLLLLLKGLAPLIGGFSHILGLASGLQPVHVAAQVRVEVRRLVARAELRPVVDAVTLRVKLVAEVRVEAPVSDAASGGPPSDILFNVLLQVRDMAAVVASHYLLLVLKQDLLV